MSDFEVCPVGTLQRLAAVEAEAKHLAAESLQADDEWRKAYCKVEAEREALRAELLSALDDWNALVKASGSPTNGGAIGHVLALRAQRDALLADAERWAPLLHAAGRVLQAVDDGYLQPDPETLQGGIAMDALREVWGAFAPARIKGGGNG